MFTEALGMSSRAELDVGLACLPAGSGLRSRLFVVLDGVEQFVQGQRREAVARPPTLAKILEHHEVAVHAIELRIERRSTVRSNRQAAGVQVGRPVEHHRRLDLRGGEGKEAEREPLGARARRGRRRLLLDEIEAGRRATTSARRRSTDQS